MNTTKIINKEAFRGVFLHKGKRCAKIVHPITGHMQWWDGPFIVAIPIPSSDSTIRVDALYGAENLKTFPSTHIEWVNGVLDYPQVVWAWDAIKAGCTINKDITVGYHDGPYQGYNTLKAGTKFVGTTAGNPHVAGTWWVVEP